MRVFGFVVGGGGGEEGGGVFGGAGCIPFFKHLKIQLCDICRCTH